jgi:hypothetical protein
MVRNGGGLQNHLGGGAFWVSGSHHLQWAVHSIKIPPLGGWGTAPTGDRRAPLMQGMPIDRAM